jgi:hypothetical protein
VHPNSNADRYHQKQRERRRKTNRICIHLNTTSPAFGHEVSPRGFADTIIGGAAVRLYAAFGGASSRSWETIRICPFFGDMGRPIVHRQG